MTYDLTILTDHRYIQPKKDDRYTQNVLDEDRLLQEACRRLGLSVYRTAWDDPKMDWSQTRFVVFRTTWDYFDRFPEFSAWLERIDALTTMNQF